MSQCSERWTEDAVCATWEGSQTAQQRDVAWVAALNITSQQHTYTEPFPIIDPSELVSEQRKDPVIGTILELKENGTEITEDRRRMMDKPTRKLSREWSRLKVENGLLYRAALGRKQLVLPATYKQTALTYLHDEMGHVGVERVLSLERERFYWPFMKKDIEEYVTRRCHCIKQWGV